jgi:hypothetical protein
MKPSTNKYYQVKELTIYKVITIVIREYTAFSKNELSNIHLLNTKFMKMIPKLQQWLQIDFSSLRKPQLIYKSQMQIDPHQVCMENAAMAHFGLDLGRFVQWVGGKYTGQHRDLHSTLAAVRGHVLADGYTHMMRILLDGCPAQLNFEELLSKEIDEIMCCFSPYCYHNTQTMVIEVQGRAIIYVGMVLAPSNPLHSHESGHPNYM